MNNHYRLIVTCPDRTGIVATISNTIASHGGYITEANQYSDTNSHYFFMRYAISTNPTGVSTKAQQFDADGFQQAFASIAKDGKMHWRLTNNNTAHRVILMVSKQSHCLTDLLYRWKCGDMHYDIPCVISNHEDLRGYVEWHGIPYHCVPIPKDQTNKQHAFTNIVKLFEHYSPTTIVLARYMQVLPPWVCRQYQNQVINIHHSFLPSFAGAKPYHQAQARGVKLTGATCHYVTEDLDAGPIIEQDVIRISHHDAIDDIIRLGKDVEKSVLARGLGYHLEDRVLVHGNKTVVFN